MERLDAADIVPAMMGVIAMEVAVKAWITGMKVAHS
jgi:hypothetical protein